MKLVCTSYPVGHGAFYTERYRFETTDKRDLAEELFQQLQKNRYNLKGLQELEERINSL